MCPERVAILIHCLVSLYSSRKPRPPHACIGRAACAARAAGRAPLSTVGAARSVHTIESAAFVAALSLRSPVLPAYPIYPAPSVLPGSYCCCAMQPCLCSQCFHATAAASAPPPHLPSQLRQLRLCPLLAPSPNEPNSWPPLAVQQPTLARPNCCALATLPPHCSLPKFAHFNSCCKLHTSPPLCPVI